VNLPRPNERFESLLTRHPRNPILLAEDWPYPAHSVFDPGAARLADGTTLLLCRVEDRRGRSHLCAARSVNGIDGWIVDDAPTMLPDPARASEEQWGLQDPRITYLQELGKHVVAYTAIGSDGPRVALALTEDFGGFERLGAIAQLAGGGAAVLPSRVRGRFAMLHRSRTDAGAHIAISYSTDLRSWGGDEPVLTARKGVWWDAQEIALSAPPIETPRGWLLLYRGVRQTPVGALHRVGLALLALDEPERCLLRGDEWVFGPEATYESIGDVPNVVSPCGFTLAPDRNTLRVYYGGADSCVAMASASLKRLLRWLDAHGEPSA
jgi:predicted GH43/DUF377 family glycosyl hydrolase